MPRQRQARAQLADEAGGVERRAAGQLVAVEQHDVALAELREVVGDRGAADAAADDHDARAVGQLAGRTIASAPAAASQRSKLGPAIAARSRSKCRSA